MSTYYARHTAELDIDEPTRGALWERRLVAIHFPGDGEEDTQSLDPDDYQGSGKRAMRLLLEMAAHGGYVCAQHHGQEDVQVGYIPKGARIQLLRGKWGTLNGLEGREAILKYVELTSAKIVRPSDYATILVGRPRQGALNRWPSAGSLIEKIVRDELVDRALESLSFAQQEILCSEFLRTSRAAAYGLPTLVNLILPVGRTMKDLDFIGIAQDGKPIFAQVTYSDLDAASCKIERLRRYDDGRDCHLLLFCATKRPDNADRIKIVPLDMVFKEFTDSKAGKAWLKFALDVRSS